MCNVKEEINKYIKFLKTDLKRSEEFYKETDCSEASHRIDNIKFCIQHIKELRKKLIA